MKRLICPKCKSHWISVDRFRVERLTPLLCLECNHKFNRITGELEEYNIIERLERNIEAYNNVKISVPPTNEQIRIKLNEVIEYINKGGL